MVEAPRKATRLEMIANGTFVQAIKSSHGAFVYYSDYADALRENAELRAQSDRFCDKYLAALKRAEAAEAENARLRALPLKDEVERVVEPFADIAGEAWADENGWTVAACPNDRIRDWFGPSAFRAARSLLSRLRAGEQEGWQSMDSAPKDGTEILVCYDAKSDPYVEDEKTGRLTPYGAHSEGGDFLDGTGITVAVWVDGWHESEDEYGSGYWMPGWWFAWFNGDTDLVVAPTGWLPLDRLPAAPKQGEAR